MSRQTFTDLLNTKDRLDKYDLFLENKSRYRKWYDIIPEEVRSFITFTIVIPTCFALYCYIKLDIL